MKEGNDNMKLDKLVGKLARLKETTENQLMVKIYDVALEFLGCCDSDTQIPLAIQDTRTFIHGLMIFEQNKPLATQTSIFEADKYFLGILNVLELEESEPELEEFFRDESEESEDVLCDCNTCIKTHLRNYCVSKNECDDCYLQEACGEYGLDAIIDELSKPINFEEIE